MKTPSLLTLCALLSCNATWCAAVTAPVDTLRQAVVTVYAQRAEVTSPTPFQRIDSAAIATHGITDMGDALRRLAGVNLRDYGGAGGVKTVSVRGLGATHTTVTRDGLAVTDAQQGSIDLGRFSIETLGCLELHTLDNAALLCPVRNLSAATIALNTAMHNAQSRTPWHGTLALHQGSWNCYNPNLSLHKNISASTALKLSADYFFSLNNYPFYISNGIASETQRRTNSRMQKYSFEADLLQTTRKGGEIRVKTSYTNNHRRLPGQVILYVKGNNERQNDENTFAQLRWQQRFGRWSVMAAARFNWQELLYSDIDGQYPGGRLDQNYWQREWYATAGASLDLSKNFTLAYSTDYALSSLSSNLSVDNSVKRHTWLQALSLQFTSRRWNVVARCLANISRDKVKSNGQLIYASTTEAATARDVNRLSPSLTASFKVIDNPLHLYVRAGFKETFRQPTFVESYYYHLGSTSLLPEKARQLNAGITLQSSPAEWLPLIVLTADAYVNRVTNRIVSVPYTLQVWRTVNLGSVDGKGADLSLESRFAPTQKHNLVVGLNYSFQQITNGTEQSSFAEGAQLAYTPRHSGAASLAWENPWLNAVAHTTFSSERWSTLEHMATTCLPAYVECGFAVYRNVTLKKVSLSLRADLINVFNKRYEIIRRYPMPGRSYKLSASIHF